ncbi:hypothetical protein BV22DRAFT_1005886 [Leucogyrophana mollusca]|uniref:Uncharacterized protein n=1 Tax=Leucogyrophana mollusca TaxID=85980 RepID=A0ACB8BQW1_9AGAM|nr:hypothetical protein BV22DRAFT_1005886 [Leucogyrophana mollusca]
MPASFRLFNRHVRSLSKAVNSAKPAPSRSFHSPFVALNSTTSPLTSAPSSASNVSTVYEKQDEHSPDPQISSSGTRTYVVSEPDPSNTPYQVPSGAYPTSAPYVNFKATDAPNYDGQHSSSSASLPHPHTTGAAPQNEAGVGESAAVRHAGAPGMMGRKGGSHGGLGLMSKAGTKEGNSQLSGRNPSPDSDVAPKWSKLGVDHAWKERK